PRRGPSRRRPGHRLAGGARHQRLRAARLRHGRRGAPGGARCRGRSRRPRRGDVMKVVVAGWVAGFPTAGFLWHALSYALGFRELGHEVWFLDDTGDEPWGWDPESGEM